MKFIGESEKVRERVELILAFEDERWLIGRANIVVLAIWREVEVRRWWRLEGVAIWRFDYIFGLGVNGSEDEGL